MNRRPAVLPVVACLCLCLGAARPAPTDEQIRQRLPGTWTSLEVQAAVTVRSRSVYGQDGFVVYSGQARGPGVELAYRVRSRWWVEGGALVAQVVETNQPDLLPAGSRKRDRVLAIDARTYRYRDEQGAVHEERRAPAR